MSDFNKYDFKISDVCFCDCHKKDVVCICFLPCCELQGKEYLSKQGKLVVYPYIKLKEEHETNNI